jgi:hypothetical protein
VLFSELYVDGWKSRSFLVEEEGRDGIADHLLYDGRNFL